MITLGWGVLVAATGGINWTIGGIALRSRAPDRALALGFALLAVYAFLFRETLEHELSRAAALLRRRIPAAAVSLAIGLGLYGVYFGSFTAGGSDSYGYVSQAYSWLHGTLPRAEPVPIRLPWPSGDASLAPLGYTLGPDPHTIVPIYAPGLPLMMAASLAVGRCGPYLVVPLCAALMVWLTFVLGRRAEGPWTGLVAALLAATSPIVLMQSAVPMRDLPTATLMTAAACAALNSRRRDVLWCGLLTASAMIVRPHLPVVPLVLLLHVAFSSPKRERLIRVVLFITPVAAAAAAIAVLNTLWHGSPDNSGFGSAGELFNLSNVVPNLARYPAWLWRSQSPLVMLAILPLIPRFNRDGSRPAVRLCAALFLATSASYLVYSPFEEWWYLRFLLPGLAPLFVLVAMALVVLARRIPRPWGVLAAAAVVTLATASALRFTRETAPPAALKMVERRYVDVGDYIHGALPANAVVLTVQQSGSVRFYGGRLTIRWDLIDRDWSGRAAAELERLGLHPYLVIEDFELPLFRNWSGLAPETPLPWPLVARMPENGGVSVLDLSATAQRATPVVIRPGGAPLCLGPAPFAFARR